MKINPLPLTCLLSICCLSGVFSPAYATTLTPFEAHYTVSTGQQSVGNASLSLSRKKAYWLAALTTEPTGLYSLLSRGNAHETSLFAVGQPGSDQAAQLTTLHYTFFQQKAKPGRNQNAKFRPATGQITLTNDDKSETVLNSTPPVYDPLSSLFHIMQLLANSDPASLELSLFNRGKVAITQFKFATTETVETPMGRYAARHVVRRTGNSNREVHIWYAKALGFVPVKIEQFKKGALVARLSLTSIKQ